MIIKRIPREGGDPRSARRDGAGGVHPADVSYAQQGFTPLQFHELRHQLGRKPIRPVSGQNSNNSVRIPNEFLPAVPTVPGNSTAVQTARWPRPSRPGTYGIESPAAWICADPGVQYDTINEWHTCPEDGRINASNPCSEYMFLDDTACNLASLNLTKFYSADGQFEVEHFRHAVRLWTIALEISVLMASFPSRSIAEQSYQFRTLGLGYANLGSVLMRLGIPTILPKHGRFVELSRRS